MREAVRHGMRCRGRRSVATRATAANGSGEALRRVLVLEGANSRTGCTVVKMLNQRADVDVSATISGGAAGTSELADLGIPTYAHDDASPDAILEKARPNVVVSCISPTLVQGSRSTHMKNGSFIDAAKSMGGLDRFVLLSSIGAGSSECALPGQAKDVMKPLLAENHAAEAYLEDSGLDHVVLRLAPGNNEAGDDVVGSPVLTESPMAYGWITCGGVASLVVQCMASDRVLGGTFSCVDSSTIFVTNPFLRPLEFHEPLPFEIFSL